MFVRNDSYVLRPDRISRRYKGVVSNDARAFRKEGHVDFPYRR
jgi:hypothetical protein